MVADIEGSTRLAQTLPPEEIPRVTGGWFKACREVVESHGGEIKSFMGDGFFCFWDNDRSSAAGILAALRELGRLKGAAYPKFRVVAHHGMVTVGSVPTIGSPDLHGPAVNFVFRMEKIAGSLNEPLLVSDAAHAELGVPAAREHHSEVSGYDGMHRFVVPEVG